MLYRRRAFNERSGEEGRVKDAFDKAVRRKPLAFAADAGLKTTSSTSELLFAKWRIPTLGMKCKKSGEEPQLLWIAFLAAIGGISL